MSTIPIASILVKDRIRKDMGDIDALCNSIKEFGLIQPIVLVFGQIPGSSNVNDCAPKLVAGGRRLTAVKRLGWKELLHGRDFIWRDELRLEPGAKNLRLKAVELEENLRRQSLSWQEEVKAKADLLTLMQSIYGAPSSGGLTRLQRKGLEPTGFGVNKLAAMLGESNTQTSKDLELASVISKMPHLAKADTKESARRQLSILGAVASMTSAAKARVAVNTVDSNGVVVQEAKKWTLYEGDFRDNISQIADGTVDLVYTDLPYGVSLSQSAKHDKGVVGYDDKRDNILSDLPDFTAHAYRILHEDRFAVFWFGFNYYGELLQNLKSAGFLVNFVPVVWYKHTRTTENPNTRYANAYDAALVAMKGNPVFIRPGQVNVVDIPAVAPGSKLQIAQQPEALCERFIQDMTSTGSLVVDFCAGSGTTGVASLRLKRSIILFEREPQAIALIKARLGAM